MSVKVTVLGSGSAYGVPVIGGDWGNCDPNNPKNRRMSPSILIENNGAKVMVDFGPDVKEQTLKFGIREIDGVLFTHPHADHITGCFHLPMYMRYFSRTKNLPLFADRATRKDIERVWWFQNDPKINVEYSGEGRPYWREILPHEILNICGMEVMPILQHHGKMDSIGYRVGNFAYSTDWNSMPEESYDYLHDLDVWLVECDSETPTTMHQHLEQVLKTIERVKPKKAYLCHLDLTMDYDTISKKLPENVELSYDGLIIETT